MRSVQASLDLVRSVWGRGPAMHKEQPDLDRYDFLIGRLQPQVLVETGLYYGGSQLWFAQRVPHVITVEMDGQRVRDFHENKHGLGKPPGNGYIVEGHSHEVYPAVAAMAKKLAADGPIMVVLDSDHGTDVVYGELVRYCQLVTPGSYLVCEDGILHYMEKGHFKMGNWFDGDPLLAIEKFLSEHPEFVPDMQIEDMHEATTNPKGWLRRMK